VHYVWCLYLNHIITLQGETYQLSKRVHPTTYVRSVRTHPTRIRNTSVNLVSSIWKVPQTNIIQEDCNITVGDTCIIPPILELKRSQCPLLYCEMPSVRPVKANLLPLNLRQGVTNICIVRVTQQGKYSIESAICSVCIPESYHNS